MGNKSEYKSLAEWRKANPKDYQLAYLKNYLDDICDHYGWDKLVARKERGHWDSKEKVLAEARKYPNKSKWIKSNGGSHKSALKNGWYDECTAHMIPTRKPKGYWTKELVLVEAKKYKTKAEWVKNDNASYKSGRRLGCLDECFKHMETKVVKPRNYWKNKERCIAEARKYNRRCDWEKSSSSSYNSAIRNGWQDECTAHMIEIIKPKGYWDIKDNVITSSKPFNSTTKWVKECSSAYQSAKRNGWFDECTKHMK